MRDRLTVAVNLLFLPPGRKSGTASYAWNLLGELAKREGIELLLFAQDGWTPWDGLPSNMRVVRCPVFRGRVGRVFWEQTRLTGLAQCGGADLVFSPGYVAPLSRKLPQVITVHDMYYARCPEAVRWTQRQYWRFFIPRSVRIASRVIAVSETTRRDIEAVIPEARGKTVTVLEAPRVLSLGNPPDPSGGSPYFLALISVTANKNPETLVQAAASLRRTHGDARLVIIGEDPLGLLKQAVERHRPGAAIEFIGNVSDEALAGWMAHAAAFVTASSYEGFGLPPLEAQALGLPVIASRGGALPEILGEGALYADHTDWVSFAEAMRRVLAEQDLRDSLIEAGRANAARYSWAKAAEETEAVLRLAAGR